MLRYSKVERRGRLDLRIGSILNFLHIASVTHVGAHLAEEANEYAYFDLNVTWIEAIPELVERIQKTGLPDKQKIFQAMLADHSGTTQELNLLGPEFALSSVLDVQHPNQVSRKISLTTSILDELPSTDLLVLDVQGAELNVLRGGAGFLKQCQFVFVEVSLGDIYYRNTPTFNEIDDLLKAAGFTKSLCIMHGHGGQEGNCLYVKKNNFNNSLYLKLFLYQLFRTLHLSYRNARRNLNLKLEKNRHN